jgi:hypothetical protein
VAWWTAPLRAAGPIPQGFVAPQAKVSTFSFVASRLVEEFLAALPPRVLQQAPRPPHHRSQGGAGEDGFPARHPDHRQSRRVAGPLAPHRPGRAILPPAQGNHRPRQVPRHPVAPERAAPLLHFLPDRHREERRSGRPRSRQSAAIIVRHYRELTTEETLSGGWNRSDRPICLRFTAASLILVRHCAARETILTQGVVPALPCQRMGPVT